MIHVAPIRMAPIHIAIADDHAELRVAIRLLLARSESIKIVCEASNGREAIQCVLDCRPDILVMDIQMPELDGLAAVKQITHLPVATRTILISSEQGQAFIEQAAAAGAHGFVPKDKLVDSLHLAIEAVHRGERYF